MKSRILLMISVVLLMSIQVFLPTSYAQSSGDALAQALSAYGLKNPTVVIVRNSAEISYEQSIAEFSSLEQETERLANISKIASDQVQDISIVTIRQIFDDGQIIEIEVDPIDASDFLANRIDTNAFLTKITIQPLTRGLRIVPDACVPEKGDNCRTSQACSCYQNEQCIPDNPDADIRGCVVVNIPTNAELVGTEYICVKGYGWDESLANCVIKTEDILTDATDGKGGGILSTADAPVMAYSYRNWNQSNLGKYDQLGAGWHPVHGESRAYIKFDLASIDPATAGKATLRLYHLRTEGGNEIDLGVYQVLDAWEEGIGTFHDDQTEKSAAPGEISWVQQPLIDSNVIASFNPGNGAEDWTEVDITPLVKTWLAGAPNYGLVIKPMNPGPESVYYFASRERDASLDGPKGESKAPALAFSGNAKSSTVKLPWNLETPEWMEPIMLRITALAAAIEHIQIFQHLHSFFPGAGLSPIVYIFALFFQLVLLIIVRSMGK